MPSLGIIGTIAFIFFYRIPLVVFWWIIIPISILYVIPNLYLHINHFKYFKNRSYIFTEDMIIENGKVEKSYNVSDIESLTFYATKAKLADVTYQRLPYHDYYLANLKLKSGESIILSSIQLTTLNEFLYSRLKNKVIIKEESDFFPMVNSHIS